MRCLLALALAGCAAKPTVGVANDSSHDLVIRVTGSDGRVGSWWVAAGATGVARADQWADLEAEGVEILLSDGCRSIFSAPTTSGVVRVGAALQASIDRVQPSSAALPVTSRCAP